MHVSALIKRGLTLVAVIASMALLVPGAFAASASPTTFGNASFNQQGVQLTSDTSAATPYAGIDFPSAAGMSLSSITSLDAEYQMTTGDCSGGAPRYSISLSGGQNIFVYFGEAPEYTCGSGYNSQSNLLYPYVDTSQLPGGTFYDTWSHALQLAGAQTVTDLAIVLDGGWAGTQVAEIYSASINDTVFNFAAPTSKDQCKNGGWQNFSNPGAFKNQGDCVSFVATHGKNKPNG